MYIQFYKPSNLSVPSSSASLCFMLLSIFLVREQLLLRKALTLTQTSLLHQRLTQTIQLKSHQYLIHIYKHHNKQKKRNNNVYRFKKMRKTWRIPKTKTLEMKWINLLWPIKRHCHSKDNMMDTTRKIIALISVLLICLTKVKKVGKKHR